MNDELYGDVLNPFSNFIVFFFLMWGMVWLVSWLVDFCSDN